MKKTPLLLPTTKEKQIFIVYIIIVNAYKKLLNISRSLSATIYSPYGRLSLSFGGKNSILRTLKNIAPR